MEQIRRPKTNEIYRHFKGNLYKIITLAKDSESGEEMVVYQALYGEYPIYVRPLVMFMEVLDKKRYPQAEQKYRFEPADQLVNLDWQEREILLEEEACPAWVPEPGEPKEQEPRLDPLLEAFLEADSYRERLNILRGLEHRITQDMITTMAIALDLEIPENTLEKRYKDLENSILTLEKYER